MVKPLKPLKAMKAIDRRDLLEHEDVRREQLRVWIAVAVAVVMTLLGILMGHAKVLLLWCWPLIFLGIHVEQRRELHREREKWRKRLARQAGQSDVEG